MNDLDAIFAQNNLDRLSAPKDANAAYPRAERIVSSSPGPRDPGPFLNQALTFASQLIDTAANMTPPEIAISVPELPEQPVFLGAERPTLQEVSWSLPGLPTEFTGSLQIDDYLPEPFDASPPTLVLGAAPVADLGTLPSAPAVALNFVDPQLNLTLPAAPSLLSINVRQFQGLAIPAVPADAPEFDLIAPSIREYVPGQQYSSALLSALEDELLRRITEGGTGLNPDVETAIWDRGREREARTMRESLDQLDRMEGMGFALPPGVYLDARLKVATENAAAHMGLSREIMIKQAELELESVRAALTTAQTVEGEALRYANQVEQRAFDAARYATEAGISIYNARVQAFSAYLDAYKAKLQAYDAQVRSELAKVEVYRLEIQAEQLKTEINTARVQQFRVLTDAALSAVEVYKAEIAGIRTKAEIEELKVRIFGEQVRAYGSRVNAYTASVEGFRAGVQAEVAKQDAFRATVQAYGAQVDAGAKAIDARVAVFNSNLRIKEAEWANYSARARTEAERIRSIASINEAVARMYQSDAAAVGTYNEVLARQWSATTQTAINTTQIALAQARANAELFMTQRSIVLDAAKVGATVSAQLGAAALSANSFSTSFNNSRSVSSNASLAYSYSESRSRSTSSSDSTVRSLSV